MPTAKPRSSRRSSSTSFSSTTITVIFVALSMLLIWLLFSNSFSAPQSISESATKTLSKITSISHSHSSKPSMDEVHPVHEDIQGELLHDSAVKSDDLLNKLDDAQANESAHDQKDASSDPDTILNINLPDHKDTSTDQKVDEAMDEHNNKDEQETKQENDVPRTDVDDATTHANLNDQISTLDKDTKELPVEEQAPKDQVFEESSMTHKEEVIDQITKENQQVETQPIKSIDQEINGRQSFEETEVEKDPQVDNANITQNLITNEDQERRVKDQHQQQEDGRIHKGNPEVQVKDFQGAIIDDQVHQDDTPVNSVEDVHTSQKIDENNEQLKDQETSTDGERNMTSLNQKMNKETSSKKNGEASFPNGESTETPKEPNQLKESWSTQVDHSENQKERRKDHALKNKDRSTHGKNTQQEALRASRKTLSRGASYLPGSTAERVQRPIDWPQSRDKIWYHNVPHTLLAEVKGHQNWVKVSGEFITFPGGGTQFVHGALHYIDFIQQAVPDIAWGKRSRVVLDVGCGVASFGGYLFERDVLAMSFAPKDEHEAQVQFALERGIPAISAVMGSQRLPFPSKVFDVVHCARCRVPWHADGGALLLELNRLLKPGGYFVWSATPVYQKLEQDVKIWKEMTNLTVAMCWELVAIKKDRLNSVGVAVYRKPDSNDCYEQRKQNGPPMCKSDDDPDAAWYIPLQSCMHRVPLQENERGSQLPEEWPKRLQTPPYWLNRSHKGIYGKPAPDDFTADYKLWRTVVSRSYMSGLGISWSNVRNVMDMRSVYGGFAAALKDLKIWVMNVVNIDSPDTLPIIYERGLFGIYHDWCESFSTYPRTYDLLHADHLFSRLKKRCKLVSVMAEVDRIVRPGGKLIVRDEANTVGEVEKLLKSLHWEIFSNISKKQERILSAQKSEWRPHSFAAPS
ncbi:UNVERIFIED_CONTAM: putative methyltransferase PMT27 [Sesamum latifolium]|uniref:Methyltransferase PMT27 n=1 Tax=Sesamum latifolium TaxID=2727402 RepID=A0AAW2SG04_9LAMI